MNKTWPTQPEKLLLFAAGWTPLLETIAMNIERKHFNLGRILVTSAAHATLTQEDILSAVPPPRRRRLGAGLRRGPAGKRTFLARGAPAPLGLPIPRRREVLDHHRGRPPGDDDPASQRLLAGRGWPCGNLPAGHPFCRRRPGAGAPGRLLDFLNDTRIPPRAKPVDTLDR